jgi:hypothetical protein
MHKCINKSVGNIYHLEQWVDNFFPYSQKQLGFDKPCSIIFQSDKKNSQRMLGKTAYYDPAAHEVYLYIDGRHPKDVMRSLSHELVHHAQNCRGDFTGAEDTGPGYAQNNPHMRKMEREAYTKGNLIFRDFEDLIKTGKVTIDIDFKKSGEPKMSLKEWKNNELNMLMMKKWGLLKETKDAGDKIVGEAFSSSPGASRPFKTPPMANSPAYHRENVPCDGLGNKRPDWVGKEDRFGGYIKPCPERDSDGNRVEENCPHAEEGGEALDVSAPGMEVHVDDISQLAPEEAFGAGIAAARDAIDQLIGTDDQDAAPEGEFEEVEEIQEGGMRYRGEEEPLHPLVQAAIDAGEDPAVAKHAHQTGRLHKSPYSAAAESGVGKQDEDNPEDFTKTKLAPRGAFQEKKMISVKEAKRLTQQIIERYLAEKK